LILLRPSEKIQILFYSSLITQTDIDTGYVYNTAIVSGTTPTDVIVNGTSSDPFHVQHVLSFFVQQLGQGWHKIQVC
jgi:hypothetical protein